MTEYSMFVDAVREVTVEADDEAEAVEKAIAQVRNSVSGDWNVDVDKSTVTEEDQ